MAELWEGLKHPPLQNHRMPLIRCVAAWNSPLQIISCQGFCPIFPAAVKGQNAMVPPGLGGAERGRFLDAQGAKISCAGANFGRSHLMRQSSGGGAWTWRKREDVQVSERQALDERGGVREISLSFIGETCYHVGAYGGIRQEFADQLDAPLVVFGAIPAVHGAEDAIRR